MPTSPSTIDALHQQLKQLQGDNQGLLQQEADLQGQLNTLRAQLVINNREILLRMDDFLSRYLHDQRTRSQEKFWADFSNNGIVFRGLSRLMDVDPDLRTSFQAVADGLSTDTQQKDVLLALLAELSGQPVTVLPVIASRAIDHNDGDTTSTVRYNTVDPPIELDDGDDAELSPVFSLADPDVKSETDSSRLAHGSPIVLIDPALTNDIQSPGDADAHLAGTNPLERNFPGLLQQLRESENAPHLSRAIEPPTLASAKRSQTADDKAHTPVPAAKKPRLGKDTTIPPAFSLLMKKLEVIHAQNASRILETIKCSKCGQTKRDSRVLNCLHVYCHRCTQKLRIEAEKGNAVNGFRAFCVQEGCTEVVSGKTAVVDPEVMEFLVWYDKQTPGLTTSTAQLHVLNKAQARRPDDHAIGTLLGQTKKQIMSREMSGENDEVCNVLEVAKLAKKLG